MARADNSGVIIKAARDRRESALQRARAALQHFECCGGEINFRSLADAAGVSRSWLYREPTLRSEIERLRHSRSGPQTSQAASAQRASYESMQRRLEALLGDVARLREENSRLRDQVARLHGERRAGWGRRIP